MTQDMNNDTNDSFSNESGSDVEVFDLTDGAESSDVEVAGDSIDEDADHPWNRPGRWYVVHTQAGYEKKVRVNLLARIQSMDMEERIFEVVIPMEEVVEIRNGQKRTTERKFFPGYVLVEMIMNDDTWHLVKNTSKVTGFVGGAKNRPAPISGGTPARTWWTQKSAPISSSRASRAGLCVTW